MVCPVENGLNNRLLNNPYAKQGSMMTSPQGSLVYNMRSSTAKEIGMFKKKKRDVAKESENRKKLLAFNVFCLVVGLYLEYVILQLKTLQTF